MCTIAAASHPLRGVVRHLSRCRLPLLRSSHTLHNVIVVIVSRPPSLWNSCSVCRIVVIRLLFDFRLTFVGLLSHVHQTSVWLLFDVCWMENFCPMFVKRKTFVWRLSNFYLTIFVHRLPSNDVRPSRFISNTICFKPYLVLCIATKFWSMGQHDVLGWWEHHRSARGKVSIMK